MIKSNFDKNPQVKVEGHECLAGWHNIAAAILRDASHVNKSKKLIAVECYHGVYLNEILSNLSQLLQPALIVRSEDAMHDESFIASMVQPFVTDDPVFGYITSLEVENYFDNSKTASFDFNSHMSVPSGKE